MPRSTHGSSGVAGPSSPRKRGSILILRKTLDPRFRGDDAQRWPRFNAAHGRLSLCLAPFGGLLVKAPGFAGGYLLRPQGGIPVGGAGQEISPCGRNDRAKALPVGCCKAPRRNDGTDTNGRKASARRPDRTGAQGARRAALAI